MSNFNPGNYYLNIDRYGSEITNGGGAPDFNPTPINYVPTASGNTNNLNSFVIDPAGDIWFIDQQGDAFKVNTASLNVLTTVQPTPTATGNTTNLNSVFKDSNNITWVVDANGDAIQAGSPDVVTTLTNTITGHKIGTYTNEAGVLVDINETVTGIETNADGSFTYTNEAGTATTIPVTPCKSFLEKQTFTATAGQTSFTLFVNPSGDVHISRNGSTLNDAAANVSGNVVTYLPSQNNNEALLAGDRIDIAYVYTICTGTATVVDGSETKVIAGSGTTVTGTGTIADPYVVNSLAGAPDGSETKVVAGTNTTVTGTGTIASPYVINSLADGSETKVTAAVGSDITVTGAGTIASPYVIASNLSRIGDFAHLGVPADQTVSAGSVFNFNSQIIQNGSWVTKSGTSLILSAGGIYEVEAAAFLQGSAAVAYMTYGIYANNVLTGSQAWVIPVTHSTVNQTGQPVAKAYIVATANVTVNVRAANSSTTFTLRGGVFNGINYSGYFTAKCIGII